MDRGEVIAFAGSRRTSVSIPGLQRRNLEDVGRLREARCPICDKLLCRMDGRRLQAKCRRCGNLVSVEVLG